LRQLKQSAQTVCTFQSQAQHVQEYDISDNYIKEKKDNKIFKRKKHTLDIDMQKKGV